MNSKLNSNMLKPYLATGIIGGYEIGYYVDISLPSQINLSSNVWSMTLSYINPTTGENICDPSLAVIVISDNTLRIVAATSAYVGLTVKAKILYT